MMERWPHLILFLTSFLMVLASVDARVKSVYVFGDSLFDPGNNRLVKNCTAQANFPPYGSNFFHRPTGRFTNGRTVADFIAQFLGIKYQRPYQEVYRKFTHGRRKHFPANGVNFASAGSGVLQDTNKNSGVASIQVQLQQFQELVYKKHLHKKLMAKSLFFLESGSNDIYNYFLSPTQNLPSRAYVRLMLREVVRFLDIIYKHGARKIAIFSVGPMGCVPARVLLPNAPTNKCFGRVNAMVKYYNTGLESLVHNIPKKYHGAIGTYGVVYTTVQRFRANPRLYGFGNVNEACCGDGPLNGMLQCGLKGYKMCPNPNDFFFWDYFHPSEHTYKLLSDTLWAGGMNQVRPMNLKTLANITLPSN